MRSIAKGNYSNKVKSDLPFIPKEFSDMIEEFNIMSEKIEQLDSFKSNLIDTVSHEFRTPLTSIKGFSSTLLRTDASFNKDMQRKLLKIISDQADRLSRMVEDLLVVPKLEGNILKLNLQEVEIDQVMEDIMQFFPNCTFDINSESNLVVLGDQDRLEQIFINLFENANKYSYPKGLPIRVCIKTDKNFAHIIVSNSAEEVPKDKLNSLFDKFVRLDDTLTRTTGGTGLGLYITKGLIELMGGKIWLEADKNFKVNFTLPLVKK
jgi:two-component system phosphate regulon sensor histidine kinase PhoR